MKPGIAGPWIFEIFKASCKGFHRVLHPCSEPTTGRIDSRSRHNLQRHRTRPACPTLDVVERLPNRNFEVVVQIDRIGEEGVGGQRAQCVLCNPIAASAVGGEQVCL
jgi:hypothetical protein